MVAHKNFYETIQEARMRLRNTIVRYRDDFYYVLEVSDHMADGKFRVYMDILGCDRVGRDRLPGFPDQNGYESNSFAKKLDDYIDKNPDCGLVRKYADSRHFYKFRPFPLGNVNTGGSVVFCERTPTRNMHQGLLQEAVMATNVSSTPPQYDPNSKSGRGIFSLHNHPLGNSSVNVLGDSFYSMLKGLYPSYEEVITNLRDPSILNKGCAFHRDYSVMRGPLDMLFLCHRHSGVGLIDKDNTLYLGSPHLFLKEELTELNLFNSIQIKEVSTYA